MTVQGELLNATSLSVTNPEINCEVDGDKMKMSMNTSSSSSMTSKVGIASIVTAVSILISVKAEVTYIEPNDFVNSCFGGGYWEEDYGWSESDCWAE